MYNVIYHVMDIAGIACFRKDVIKRFVENIEFVAKASHSEILDKYFDWVNNTEAPAAPVAPPVPAAPVAAAAASAAPAFGPFGMLGPGPARFDPGRTGVGSSAAAAAGQSTRPTKGTLEFFIPGIIEEEEESAAKPSVAAAAKAKAKPSARPKSAAAAMLSDEEEGYRSPAPGIRSDPSAVFTQSPGQGAASIRSPSLVSLASLVAERQPSNITRRQMNFRGNVSSAAPSGFRGNGSGAAAYSSSSSSSSSAAPKNKTQPSSRAGKGRPGGSAAASGANSDSAGSVGLNIFEPRPRSSYLRGAPV